MPKYLSGRVKRTPQDKLTEDRYLYLGLDQAEPNLGDPPELDTIPPGQQYQIVSLQNYPGQRFWKEIGGGTIPAAHTVRDEGLVVPRTGSNPNLGINSITDVNFVGAAVTVVGFVKPNGDAGSAVTVTVAPPGEDHGVLFNNEGEFATSPYFTFDNTIGIGSVGIGTSEPSQNLHVVGNVKLDKTIYGEDNQPGVQGDLLVKTSTGGMKWQNANAVQSGAGGEEKQIQYHGSTGLVEGASNFVFDNANKRVGIGSTQPDRLLDVRGDSRFVGFTTFTDDVKFDGTGGDILFDKSEGSLVIQDGSHLDIGTNIIARISANPSAGSTVTIASRLSSHHLHNVSDNFKIKSLTGDETYLEAKVGAGVTLYTDNQKRLETTNTGVDITGTLNVSGISTFNKNVKFGVNAGIVKDSGNLEIDADKLVIQDAGSNYTGAIFESNGDVKLYSTGNQKFQTTGVGVSVSGLTTTTDLSVTGFVTSHLIPGTTELTLGEQNKPWKKLYVETIIGIDEIEQIKQLNVTGILTTKDLHVSGISSFVGVATFHSDIDVDGHAELDDVNVSGALTTQNFRVSGVSTFVGIATFGDIEVGVLTVRDRLHVSGISSFAGISTFYGDVIVGTSATVGFGSTAYFLHNVDFVGTTGITSITFQEKNIDTYDDGNAALIFKDNARLKFGNSNDLQIYHRPADLVDNSWIRDVGGGNLYLDTNGQKISLIQDGFENVQTSGSNQGEGGTMANFFRNGRVELYYDGVKKFDTAGAGVTVTGLNVDGNVSSHLIPNARDTYNLGEGGVNGKRWDTIYARQFIGDIEVQQGDLIIDNLKVTGISTFIGIATFGGGIHVQSGVTTVGFLTAQNLFVAGVTTATDFNSTSDIKLKTNIQVIDNPIEKIMKIDGVSFNWKESNKPSFGVIADNVQETLPDLVSNEDPKTVNYNGLVGLLIEVVKNQQEQINELRSLLDK